MDLSYRAPGEVIMAPVLAHEVDPTVSGYYRSQLARAFALVHAFPPPGQRSPFTRSSVPGESSNYYITVSDDPWVSSRHIPPTDQCALVPAEDENGRPTGWLQYYVVDKIYFDAERHLKKGAFVDLLAAAALINYGAVPYAKGHHLLTVEQILEENERMHLREFALAQVISFFERVSAARDQTDLSPVELTRLQELLREYQIELLRLRCRMLAIR